MTSIPTELRELQLLMQDYIVAECEPVGRFSGDERSAAEGALLAQHFAPISHLGVDDCLGIYRGMYPARMRDALLADFPAVAAALGERRFDELVRAYVALHPSRSFTLNRLSDAFPHYVRERTDLHRHAFVSELADFEGALCRIFDASESPRRAQDALRAMAPDAWGDARFRKIEAASVHTFRYPINAFYQAAVWEKPLPTMRRQRTAVLLVRTDYIIRRHDISTDGALLLDALFSGATLAAALEATLASGSRACKPDQIFAMFREWMELGVFSTVE